MADNIAPAPLSVDLIICEKILNENTVLSLIRMVDVFFVARQPDTKPEDRLAVPMQVLAMVKVRPGDTAARAIQLHLIRPDGERTGVGDPQILSPPEELKYPGAPPGIATIVLLAVTPKQLGVHYVALTIDGREVAVAPFTLVERTPEPAA